MAFQHQMQTSRYELKYLINEMRATQIRDFVRSYLVADEFADPITNSYWISSIYLDSPFLRLYWQTFQGMKNRFKLRIRFYDDDPRHPAFLEIKRRVTDVILKERAMIHREAAAEILAGKPPHVSYLMRGRRDAKSHAAMNNFCFLRDQIEAVGWLYVTYCREAFVSPESDEIRVTFDRLIHGTPYRPGAPLKVNRTGAYPLLGEQVSGGPGSRRFSVLPHQQDDDLVLEVKFTDRFPFWMQPMVQSANLFRGNASKYNACIESLEKLPGIARLGFRQCPVTGRIDPN